MSAGTQIDYAALAKQAGAISSQPPQGNVDYAALAKQAGAVDSQDSQAMAPGSYQGRKGGPILNANDSVMHTGIRSAQNALGVSEVPTSLWDEISQIGGSMKKFAGQSWDELQKATGEGNATPGLGTPFTDLLYAPHLAARGLEGLASGAENSASDIEAGIRNKDPRSVASGIGSALGMKAQLETGEQSGKAVGGAISRVRNAVSAPLADTMTKPRGTISPEQYTPAELKAYADANAIPVTAAQATENVGLRALQSSGERAIAGGSDVKAGIRATQAAIANHAGDLASSYSPNTPDLASQGSAIQKAVQDALTRETFRSNLGYSAIDQMAQGTTVDLTPVKQAAAKLLSSSEILRQSGLDPGRASSILQHISDLPNQTTFSNAQLVRSGLLDASRSPDLAISNQAQGWIKQLTGATDSAMMTAAQSKPGLEPLFRTVNEHWTQLQDDFNSPRSVLNQILAEPDPNRVPQKVTQKGQIAGSPYNAQLFDRYGIDKGPVKAAIVNDLLNHNFGIRGNNLGGYSDGFLSSMFTPGELDSVYKTGALARSAGLNTNPSGTAAVNSAIEQTANPARLGVQAAGARLTNSPAFNARMMNTRTIPPQGAATGKLAGGAMAGAGQSQDQTAPESAGAALLEKHGAVQMRQALSNPVTQDVLQSVAPNTAEFLIKRAGVADLRGAGKRRRPNG